MSNVSANINSYLMMIVLLALSIIVYEILANQVNCRKFDLTMKVIVTEKNGTLRHWTGNLWFYMSGFFLHFIYLVTYVCAKGYTSTHTQRETGVTTIGKICKADLPKNGCK